MSDNRGNHLKETKCHDNLIMMSLSDVKEECVTDYKASRGGCLQADVPGFCFPGLFNSERILQTSIRVVENFDLDLIG